MTLMDFGVHTTDIGMAHYRNMIRIEDYPEYGSSRLLQNISMCLPDHAVSQCRTQCQFQTNNLIFQCQSPGQ